MSEAEARPNSPKSSGSAAAVGEVTLTLSDIEAGLSALPRAKVARIVVWGGAVAVATLVVYRYLQGGDRTSLVVIGIVMIGLLLVNRNPSRRIAARIHASLPEDARRLRVSVSEQGFSVTSSGNESLLAWSKVLRCVESRNVFVVFLSRRDAQILPKRAFTEAELSAIRGWARTNIIRHDEPWFTPALRLRLMVWLVVFALVWIAWTYLGRG